MLIFSNYDDVDICIEPNNLYDIQYSNNYKCSKFNQKILLQVNLTYLTFGDKFNQPIKLYNSLTHLTFGYYFNQELKIVRKFN